MRAKTTIVFIFSISFSILVFPQFGWSDEGEDPQTSGGGLLRDFEDALATFIGEFIIGDRPAQMDRDAIMARERDRINRLFPSKLTDSSIIALEKLGDYLKDEENRRTYREWYAQKANLEERRLELMDEDMPLPHDSMADLGADDAQDPIFRNVTGGYRPRPQPNPNPLPPNRNRGGKGGGTGSGKGGSGKGGTSPGGPSPSGPQFGPPKEGEPMPPVDSSGKDPFGFGPPNKGGVYGPQNPDGSWPGPSNPQGAFDSFDHLNQGPKGLLRDTPTPTAAFDGAPQSRNMGSGVFTADKPVEADGYKSGPECD